MLAIESKIKYGVLYNTWRMMRQRCNNIRSKDYARYGGRGIKICKEWDNFNLFNNDMFPSFKPGLTLDRVDNNLGYFKDNCKWSTKKEQCNNTRRNSIYKGKTNSQWIDFFGIKDYTFYNLLKKTGSIEQTIIILSSDNFK